MLNVLVVDDDPTVSQVLKRSLESMGCTIENVGTCGDALVRGAESSFDLALVDINLPDGDGIDLISQLRDTAPDLHFVAMSGDCTRENEAKAREQRIIYFLVKPFLMSELRSLVDHLSPPSSTSDITSCAFEKV